MLKDDFLLLFFLTCGKIKEKAPDETLAQRLKYIYFPASVLLQWFTAVLSRNQILPGSHKSNMEAAAATPLVVFFFAAGKMALAFFCECLLESFFSLLLSHSLGTQSTTKLGRAELRLSKGPFQFTKLHDGRRESFTYKATALSFSGRARIIRDIHSSVRVCV